MEDFLRPSLYIGLDWKSLHSVIYGDSGVISSFLSMPAVLAAIAQGKEM